MREFSKPEIADESKRGERVDPPQNAVKRSQRIRIHVLQEQSHDVAAGRPVREPRLLMENRDRNPDPLHHEALHE